MTRQMCIRLLFLPAATGLFCLSLFVGVGDANANHCSKKAAEWQKISDRLEARQQQAEAAGDDKKACSILRERIKSEKQEMKVLPKSCYHDQGTGYKAAQTVVDLLEYEDRVFCGLVCQSGGC